MPYCDALGCESRQELLPSGFSRNARAGFEIDDAPDGETDAFGQLRLCPPKDRASAMDLWGDAVRRCRPATDLGHVRSPFSEVLHLLSKPPAAASATGWSLASFLAGAEAEPYFIPLIGAGMIFAAREGGAAEANFGGPTGCSSPLQTSDEKRYGTTAAGRALSRQGLRNRFEDSRAASLRNSFLCEDPPTSDLHFQRPRSIRFDARVLRAPAWPDTFEAVLAGMPNESACLLCLRRLAGSPAYNS